MARVQKLLLRPGLYEAPQGQLKATPARLRSWVDKFNRMKAKGIRVPVAHGHQPRGLPADATEREKQQFWLSALNAGYVQSLDLDENGGLRAVLDCPGHDLDDKGNLCSWVDIGGGRKVRSAIGEVSAAIKSWKDGTGEVWDDALIHVALTTLPVAHNHDGFATALSTVSTDPSEFTLSLAGFSRALSTEDEKMADKEEEAAVEDTAAAEEEEVEEAMPAALPPTPAADGGARLAECLRVLEAHGMHLPGDTTMENLAERICVAGHAKAKGVAEEDDEEEMDEEDGEPAEYSGENGGQTVEEQRPVMLSLANARSPIEKASIRREQERHKKAQLKLIDKLVKKGMPPPKATELRSRVEGYTLSLTEEGEIVDKKLDLELSTWSEVLAGSHFAKTVLGHARPEPRPGPDPEASQKAQEEAGDLIAGLAGAPRRK